MLLSSTGSDNCALCPRECGVNRANGERGFCGETDKIRIARSEPHYWEEPCISGEKGSGAVFFSGCTLGCVYCQNREISRGGKGFEVSPKELAERMLGLAKSGVHNLNLVTPTHHLTGIIKALDIARAKGLSIPVVYNCGGYEKPETIARLMGYADVYLPDMKYISKRFAKKYSAAADYFDYASKAVAEMVRQTGPCVFDENGIIQKGVIVRHLMLPGLLFESKKIIDYLYSTYGNDIYISLMSQYTRMPGIGERFPELDRDLCRAHYEALVDYCADLGIENMYIQQPGAADSRYIPEFYGGE